MERIDAENIAVKNVRIKDRGEDNHLLQLRILIHQKQKTTEIYYTVSSSKEISAVEIENL